MFLQTVLLAKHQPVLKMANLFKKRQAFSLVEVLVFISILSMFFVLAAAVITFSLRDMKINEHKIIATQYADELMEWLRSQKEVNWEAFYAKADTNGLVYCFNNQITSTTNIADFTDGDCGDSYNGISGLVPQIFKRQATLETVAGFSDQVNVFVEVEWKELGNTYKVPIKSVLTLWE